MKYKTTFIDYVLKVGNFKLKKSMLILNMFIYTIFYDKKNSSRHYCCSNVRNSEDSNGFSIKLLGTDIFIYLNGYMCTSWKNL
jgi:hypothetical protein